jgi:hypothetical protein
MKFEKYIQEGKEAKFVKAIKSTVNMDELLKYKELMHQMTMTETERTKVKEALEKKMKELGKKKK